jgi:hypothetical protein
MGGVLIQFAAVVGRARKRWKMKRTGFFFAALLLGLAAAGAEQNPELKTLDRHDDPLILKGSQLSALASSNPLLLSLMALKGGTWSPIPFQVDQVKPDGTYAFTSGELKGPDPDPNLDANDELVFLARDLGDRASGPWPDGAETGVEIEVTDPINGSKGWAYLFRFAATPPTTKTDYIKLEIDEKKGRRWGHSDVLLIGAPLDRVYPDFIAQMDPKTGAPGPDVLDRLKIRGELVFFGNIKIPVNLDDMIKCRDVGYIDGPVRILHQTWGYMELAGIEFKGVGFSTLTYYPNFMIVPVTIESASKLPDWLFNLIPNGRIDGYMDFNPNVYGSAVVSAANPFNPEVVLDGKTSPAEKALNREKEINWIAGYGPQGGLVVRLVLSQASAAQAKVTTYYVDDQTAKDPPEDDPGVSAAGFEITGRNHDLGQLARSDTFYIYAYAKRDLGPDNIHTQLDILDHPLQTRTTALEIKAR